MKNYELININEGLSSLADQKLTGRLKFKLFKAKRKVEDASKLIFETLEGVENSEERVEILDQEQTIELEKFTLEELEGLPLSIRDIGNLEPIIDFEEEA